MRKSEVFDGSEPRLALYYPKSIQRRPWSVFGAKSRPGQLQDASGIIPVYRFDTIFLKIVPKWAILGTPLDPKWLQNRTVEDRLALRPSKNGFWKGVRIKHENSMKKRCENRRFLMAQNHVWRYTLRL